MGSKDEVLYSGLATRQDATVLGQALRAAGYFQDQGVSVLLVKKKNEATIVSFPLQADVWTRPETVARFDGIGRRIAPSLGGFPIDLQLSNLHWRVQKGIKPGKTTIGTRDLVYSLGTATDADARALGAALHEAGYLRDRGVTVVLTKGDATSIGFVVSEDVWGRSDTAAVYESLVRHVAASVGGLPIELRLLNSATDAKKQIAIK